MIDAKSITDMEEMKVGDIVSFECVDAGGMDIISKCNRCAFGPSGNWLCDNRAIGCIPQFRKDGRNVYFKRSTKHGKQE